MLEILKEKIGKILLLGALCALFACGMSGEVKAELRTYSDLKIGDTYIIKGKDDIRPTEIFS